jgi:hypothetical protein
VLTITIGNAAIDVDATSNSGATSTVTSSSSITTSAGIAFDTGFTSKIVAARKGIMHNGVTYNTVKSPDTGVYWLDRNLDATQVATSSTDTAAYGGLYQWGRPADGHQLHSDPTPANGELPQHGTDGGGSLSTTITPSNGGEFIEGDTSPYDWVDPAATDGADNNNGSDRSSFLSKIDGSGICPVGFRVPTDDELNDDTINGGAGVGGMTHSSAFASFLKIPANATRRYSSGMISEMWGGYISLWSSVAYGENSKGLLIDFDASVLGMSKRAEGQGVRCRSML